LKFRKDNLLQTYMSLSPFALAFERYQECQIYLQIPLERPILDLGCGEGLFTHVLFEEKIDTGIDPNSKELERAKEYGCYQELINCAGDAIPKADGSYRTIFSNSVLEHIPDLNPVFIKVNRLLMDGGHFYFTVPSQYFEQYSVISRIVRALGFAGLANRYQKEYNKFWNQIHCYPLEKWENIVSQFGFQVVNSFSYCSREICTLNDILVPFSFPAYIMKRLINRWFLFPNIRSILIYPFYRLAMKYKKWGEKVSNGGLVFVAAKKVGRI